MEPKLITLNDRGQMTLPKPFREGKHYMCTFEKGKIVLTPMQTREEFLAELDAAEKDWEQNGGYTIEEMKKLHKL